MVCPNFDICSGESSSYNSVCYICDNSYYGYFSKHMSLMYHYIPSTHVTEHKSRTIDIENLNFLREKLENKRYSTGILDIKTLNRECPICLQDSVKMVKHPTCNTHCICLSCFKQSFLDGNIDVGKLEPEPNGYDIYDDFLFSNHIIMDFPYPNNPPDEWPEEIKKLYSSCIEWDRKEYQYNLDLDKKIKNNHNIRSCPLCRETKLNI